MRIHVLQHVPFEDIGAILNWVKLKQATVTYTRFYNNELLPATLDFDFLIVMGGPMSVNEEAYYPWLILEKAFINTAIRNNKAVLGICLGAQLIANSMGAKVYANAQKEIGWLPVFNEADVRRYGVNEGDIKEIRFDEQDAQTPLLKPNNPVFEFPNTLTVFQWHGETFDLPAQTTLLASSKVCKNQAFQYGNKVVGLQFHLESTPDTINTLIHHCTDELNTALVIQNQPTNATLPNTIQTREQMQRVPPSYFVQSHNTLYSLLNFLTS